MTTDTTLVLGATGKTGRRVLARLRLLGLPVRPASRSSATPFDWFDPDGWDDALRGVGAIYLVAPPVPGPAHAFLERAAAAGVRHVVLLSGRGADQWEESSFGREMRDAEAATRASTLQWTVLRPNNFAQNFDEELWHAPLLDGEFAVPAGPVPEPFVDVEDVADVAAAVLSRPEAHAGRTYELSGPRSLTFADAVELIARVSGRQLSFRETTPQAYTEELVTRGVDEVTAGHVAQMFVLMSTGLIADPTGDVEALLGRAPRRFEDYVLRAGAAGAWTR